MEKTIDRKSSDALTALKGGDVLLINGASMQIVRAELGYIRHDAWLRFDDNEHDRVKGTLVSMGSVGSVFAASRPGDAFRYTNGLTGTYLGEIQYRETHLRVTPVAYARDPKKHQIVDIRLVLFRSGDRRALGAMGWYQWSYNAEEVQVTSSLAPAVQAPDITKWDALPYVVSVHGPLTRAQALKHAQQVLCLPYVPGSNHSYFTEDDNVVSRGLLQVVGKKGNALVYDLAPKGRERAAAVKATVDRP